MVAGPALARGLLVVCLTLGLTLGWGAERAGARAGAGTGAGAGRKAGGEEEKLMEGVSWNREAEVMAVLGVRVPVWNE